MKILFNASIHSFDPTRPEATVLVIDRDRVAALGGSELLEVFGARASREDMGGRVILPGLTDAHMHLMHYALALERLDVETPSKAAALQRVAERAARTPPGEWLLGHGWQQNDWGGEYPSAAELDAVAPQNPVYLTGKSLHVSWANTSALTMAGIGPGTPDPLNGRIERAANGQPTGILFETAMQIVENALPKPNEAQVAEAIEAALPSLWQLGLTGAHDFDYRTAFMALQILDQEQRLKLRVTKSIPLDLMPEAVALGLRTGFGSEYLRIGSVKVFMDGALGPRTAAMLKPYEGEPENRGILNMDGEQFFEYGRQAAGSGLSMTGHAIGDKALHEILNGFQQLRAYEREQKLPALRHRIEHVQLLHPDDAGRLGQLGIIASMQPIHATSDMLTADKYWGGRVELAYSWRTQLRAGAILAFGWDAPVEVPNPFLGLHAAVTRRRVDGSPDPQGWHPEQRLSMTEALAGYTTGAAYAAGREDQIGRLSPGHYADLIVLEKDPFTCPPDNLLEMRSSATMLGENGFGRLKMTKLPSNNNLIPESLVPRLGEQLVEMGLLTTDQLTHALGYQRQCSERGRQIPLGQAIMELGFLDRPTLDQAVAEQILRLRSALEDANHNLELRVQQRTMELEEALRRLSESNTQKSNFIANISHELRTPLTHIRGYLDLLNAGSFGEMNPDQKKAVDLSLQSSLRLQSLIDDLILFSQSQRGQMTLSIASVDLNKLSRNMLVRYKKRAAENQVTFEIKIDPNLPNVQADEEKISWVIAQLLSNAIKFNRPGGKVSLMMVKDRSVNNMVNVYVADNGIGISQDRMKEIFEPFVQLDGSSTRRYGGTGLGLALVLQIIEAHGSIINVKSEIDKGTTVSFPLLITKAD